VKEEGVKEEGVKEEGVKEEGVKEEGVKEEGVKEEGVKEEGVCVFPYTHTLPRRRIGRGGVRRLPAPQNGFDAHTRHRTLSRNPLFI
jgi:hypothetical protein